MLKIWGLYVKGLQNDQPSNFENDLTPVQLESVDIPFMTIRKVQKSQIEEMQDRTVLVPVQPADIMNAINSFSFQEL